MQFHPPLTPAIFLERLNRFQAKIQLSDSSDSIDENPKICYVPNTGSMKTAWAPGLPCAIHIDKNPKRKSPFTMVMTQDPRAAWVGIHTGLTNKLVKEFIEHQHLKFLTQEFQYELHSEKTLGRSRFDYVLLPQTPAIPAAIPAKSFQKNNASINLSAPNNKTQPPVFIIEVKNVSMVDEDHPRWAQFPDSVSTRAQKHVEDFIHLQGTSAKDPGHPESSIQTVLLFVVQRNHCKYFKPAAQIDPKYASLLKIAKAKGVQILAYGCQLNFNEINLDPKQPVHVDLE